MERAPEPVAAGFAYDARTAPASSEGNAAAAGCALVSYIPKPFRLAANDPLNVQFSNIGIARAMVRVLNEMGYGVDVINFTDNRFKVEKTYDLFIGHGAP
jgi:hypothetical protein